MNTVGKIFVMLIMVLSLIFMSMAVAVYSTHVNWQAKSSQLGQQLQAERVKNQNLTEERAQLEKTLTSEIERRTNAIATLQTESEALRTERDERVKQNADLVQQAQQAAAAMLATQKTLEALRGEVDKLRDDIRTTEADKESQFKELVRLTDELFQAQGEQERLNAKNLELVEQLSKVKVVLDRRGIDANEPVDGIPPKVDGIVLAVNDQGLVEISIGTDDGLRAGHTLEVYRANKYLGRIEVVRTATDKAVAKVMAQFRQGAIQKEDRVATRLN